MSTDRTSWQVTNEASLTELVSLIGISAEEQRLLGELAGAAAAIAPHMTEAFYKRLYAHANTAEYLEGVPTERLQNMAGNWFTDLFCGKYDEDYARSRMRIGQVHVKIGLPVRYPLAMLDVVLPFGEQVVRQSSQVEAAVVAFRKILALDVAIFNQAYEDNQLKHLSELVGGERLARRLLSGE